MTMTDRRTDPSLRDLNRGLLTGAAAMLGVASVAGLAGIGLLSAALVAAARQWYRRVDLPPQQLATLKWQQAKAAADASAGAWRDVEKAAYSPRSSVLMQ
jgi:hypothetical protein